MRLCMAMIPLLALLVAGCPVWQPQDTPVSAVTFTLPDGAGRYAAYVPSHYNADRQWPLVITLHGTFGFDNQDSQIAEWKKLAEDHGFIVAAPSLRSVQGILPVSRGLWYKDLESDERTVLAVIDDLQKRYPAIDPNFVMLTGFSAGGYPLYYTGLRHPERFHMLVVRACNSDEEMFKGIEITEAVRKMPIEIIWGRDDPKPIQDQSWAAYRFLRLSRCFHTDRRELKGGHFRRPEAAYTYWAKHLPPKYRM